MGAEDFPANLLKVELKRADEFAQYSLNKHTAMIEIKKIFIEMGVDFNEYFSSEENFIIDEWEIEL
jgi:hypothetical protein